MTIADRVLTLMAGAWLVLAGPAEAATKRLSFEHGLCTYEVRFDPAKLPEAQVRGTFDLLVGTWDVVADPVSDPAAVPRALKDVEQACAATLERLGRLQVLPVPGLDALRAEAIRDAEDACRFERTKLRGYADPSVLATYAPAASACARHADALTGRTDLPAAYKTLGREVCRDNADPKGCLDRWTATGRDPARMRLEYLSFGWGNCANALTIRGNRDDTIREKLLSRIVKQYRAKETCEE